MFQKSQIIRRYKMKEFEMIPKNKLVDFIPAIRGNHTPELNILETWENHFRCVGAPYVVTSDVRKHLNGQLNIRVLTLWSEDKTRSVAN